MHRTHLIVVHHKIKKHIHMEKQIKTIPFFISKIKQSRLLCYQTRRSGSDLRQAPIAGWPRPACFSIPALFACRALHICPSVPMRACGCNTCHVAVDLLAQHSTRVKLCSTAHCQVPATALSFRVCLDSCKVCVKFVVFFRCYFIKYINHALIKFKRFVSIFTDKLCN
jgi:hypothetical protein